MGLSHHAVEHSENHKLRQGLIELCGMHGDIQRYAHKIVGDWIRERHCPWTVALHTPAAAGGKTAKAAYSVTEGNGRREEVRRFPAGQLRPAHVPDGNGERAEQAAIE